MNDKASTAENDEITQLRKQAVDALAQLKEAELSDTFDYFQALVEYKKHASATGTETALQ